MRIPSRAIASGIAALTVLTAGCGDPPVWEQTPDRASGPRPAEPGGEASNFRLRQIGAGFDNPVQVISRAGDRRLYVVERAGRVMAFMPGRAAKSPLLDIRRRVLSGGERGLLSAAFSDGGKTLYVLYTRRPDGATRVERIGLNRDERPAARSARSLLTVEQPDVNHNGGTLLTDRRGRLLLGLGDGGGAFDKADRAQDPADRLGKLLRHDGRRWRTVATGLRNPWRMSLDRASGRLWIGDVGQDRFEEVDALRVPDAGETPANLGWAAYEGRTPLGRKPLTGDSASLTWPVAGYVHAHGRCSITGGAVYRARKVRALRGRYVFGDFCTGEIFSLDAAGALRKREHADVRRERARLRGLVSFGSDRRGELYAVSISGTVHRLIPDAGGQD